MAAGSMDIALTTRWNAGRHDTGEAMVEEILGLGFTRLELGYDTRIHLVPGIKNLVAQGAVTVNSVHNFCPVPTTAPFGHPELFTLASPDRRVRESAVQHTANTIRFAAEIGASVVVMHAGNVEMRSFSRDLFALSAQGHQYSEAYDKLKLKLQITREKKARRQLGYLNEGLGRLLPVLEECRVKLAMENLPTWEAIPTEVELEEILNRFHSPWLAYWHDMGHGQIRQNLGFINQARWLERLRPHLAGMHIHDVAPPVTDHVMPPRGHIDFASYRNFANMDIVRVLEPTPRTPPEEIEEARRYLLATWFSEAPEPPPAGAPPDP